MTTRQPAFWRVVRVRDGVREYYTEDGVWSDMSGANTWAVAPFHLSNIGRVVPVYHSVRKVPRGRDFAWALRQMKAGKRVWRTSWPEGTFPWSFITLQNNGAACEAIIATDWVLAEASK